MGVCTRASECSVVYGYDTHPVNFVFLVMPVLGLWGLSLVLNTPWKQQLKPMWLTGSDSRDPSLGFKKLSYEAYSLRDYPFV